jgi:hypothetical protein
MNKNIYVDLADKLDSAGLFQESDDLMKVFSSSTSMIKTAQSGELDSILADSEKLSGWNWMIGLAAGVVGVTSIPAAIVSFNRRLDQLKEQYFEEKEVAAVPDEFNAKTYDAVKVSKLKTEAFEAISSSKPKTEIQILIPNNIKPFDPGDNTTFTIEKYKVLQTKEKKRRNGTVYEVPNPTVADFMDPSNYIKDKVIDGKTQFVEVPKKTYINHLPAKNDTEFRKKKLQNYFSTGLKSFAVAAGVSIATVIGYETQWKLYKNSLNPNIKAEYRKYLLKNKFSAKNNIDKSIILEEFTNKLNLILKQSDGVGNVIKPLYAKEKFRDAILRLFKKEIGFGKPDSSKGSNTNTNSTTQKSNSGAPSSKSRTQTRPLRPSQPKPAPPGGSTGGGGSAAPAGL